METTTPMLTCCCCGDEFDVLGFERIDGCAFCWACCECYASARAGRCQIHCAVCGVRVPLDVAFVSEPSGLYHVRCAELRDDEPPAAMFLERLITSLGALGR